MTPKQKELLDFISEYQRSKGGVSPSYEEMQRAIGVSSKSEVARIIEALEAQEFIRRKPGRARSVEVVRRVGDAEARAQRFHIGMSEERLAAHLAVQLHVPEWRILRALKELAPQ